MTLWPLPGGSGRYLSALKRFCRFADGGVEAETFVARVVRSFPGVTSTKAARSYMHVAKDLGFIELKSGCVDLTVTGRKYLRTGSKTIVRDALFERIAGVEELVEILRREPMRTGLLLEEMQGLGFEWQRDSQVRYRLLWLMEVGVIRRVGRARASYHVIGRQSRVVSRAEAQRSMNRAKID